MEYYATARKGKTTQFAATWVELKDIMLSKVSQRKGRINTGGFYLFVVGRITGKGNVRH